MCGITGFWRFNNKCNGNDENYIRRMTQVLSHRGPDDHNIWVDKNSGIALGHRRLSIIDLSIAGRQPMTSSNGQFVIVYNGEVYNAAEIRKELEKQGSNFRGHSDTEVILEACASWGIENAVKRFVGMFAFTLWDTKQEKLHLVRDRVGIKPLYWGIINDLFLFGSELKSLREHPDWKPEIDRNSLAAYMRYCYVPTPNTIYQGINKLEPGTILTIGKEKQPRYTKYWQLSNVVEEAIKYRDRAQNESDVIEEFHNLLTDAVKNRMISDVPLGAFLSGGIDSSTVVSLMQANAASAIKTFTIGFGEQDYDEAQHAKDVATHLGTDHTELYVTANDSLQLIPGIPEIYDEPFADSSQIPTFLISKLTRQHVTVALSGDGGDEVFMGYNRYLFAHRLMKYLNSLPSGARKFLGKRMHSVSNQLWPNLTKYLPGKQQHPQLGSKIQKVAELLSTGMPITYKGIISHWQDPVNIVKDSCEPKDVLEDMRILSTLSEQTEQMQFFDTLLYLPDDILTKVDRASMANSLEVRVPILDHRVLEFAWRLPGKYKLRNGESKWLLRQILYKYVPKELVERPKMGFGVPIDDWLKGPLRDWAESLIDESKMREQGYLNTIPIRKKWDEHINGKGNWKFPLWNILMFQSWYEKWMT